MKCPDAVRLMDAWVDDQLDAASVLALEDHLRDCARCRAREDGLRALRATLRRHTEYRAAPQALRERLRQRYGAGPAQVATRARWGLAMAAAALTALAIGAASWRGGFEPEIAPLRAGTGKVVYHITNSGNASAALRTLRNHLEASPRTKVVVVAHNEGVDFLLRGARDESGELYQSVVHQFRERGVEFRVCNNTLVRRKIDAQGIVPDASLVPSGIAEISRLQESEGYAYMRM
jgi:intracellular sulfur oxidation DsrE/DsrF family protein